MGGREGGEKNSESRRREGGKAGLYSLVDRNYYDEGMPCERRRGKSTYVRNKQRVCCYLTGA